MTCKSSKLIIVRLKIYVQLFLIDVLNLVTENQDPGQDPAREVEENPAGQFLHQVLHPQIGSGKGIFQVQSQDHDRSIEVAAQVHLP